MTISKSTVDVSTLKINYLTQEMYDEALENEEINANELYVTSDLGITVAENTKATKYYPVLSSGIGKSEGKIDTNDQNDGGATAVGLWYQNGVLGAPSLQVGDVDYAISTSEYDVLDGLLDAI